MRVQAKILLVLVPLVVAPLLALGWSAYHQLRTTAEQKTLNQMDTLLEQVGRQVQDHLRTTRANLELFSESVLLHSYLLTEDEDERYTLIQPSLLRLFASYQKSYPDYYEIRVLLPDGYEDTREVTGDLPNVTDEEADSPFFRAAMASEDDFYSTYLHNPDNGELALLAMKRIRLRDRTASPITAVPTLRGYLALTVKLGFMRQQVQYNRIGREGHLFFTNAQGELLLTLESHPYPTPRLRELIAAGGGEIRETLQGKKTILKGRPLHPGLALFAELPEDELLAEGRRLGVVVAAITLGAILFTTVLLFLLLRALLVTPLQQLNVAAKAIGQGKLDTRIEFSSQDEIGELARSFQEMTENVRESHRQIRHLAYHDSLTSLPNRFAFQERLQQALGDANRFGYRLAVLFLDLDNFKDVNDTLGHQAGDTLLRTFAERLVDCLREGDCVARSEECEETADVLARLGGDEFIVMLSHIRGVLAAGQVAQRILNLLQHPFIIDGEEIHAGASIGITVYPEDGADAGTLIKNADIALYHAKGLGKANYQFYSIALNEAAHQRQILERQLRRALDQEQLSLHYQPMVDTTDGRIVGVEALVRWTDPELGFVSPADFIPAAEESGLIVPLGRWVLREACRQCVAWERAGLPALRMSVNVSSVQVGRRGLIEDVAAALRDTGLPPERLDLEITETSLLAGGAIVDFNLQGLKSLGVRLSLDDFGTGHSSLSHLKRHPIDVVKIDRSFVSDLTENQDDAAIVTAVIALARGLGLEVVAEGVEQAEHLEFLQRQGCHWAQGYYFSKPLPAEELAERLTERHLRLA